MILVDHFSNLIIKKYSEKLFLMIGFLLTILLLTKKLIIIFEKQLFISNLLIEIKIFS